MRAVLLSLCHVCLVCCCHVCAPLSQRQIHVHSLHLANKVMLMMWSDNVCVKLRWFIYQPTVQMQGTVQSRLYLDFESLGMHYVESHALWTECIEIAYSRFYCNVKNSTDLTKSNTLHENTAGVHGREPRSLNEDRIKAKASPTIWDLRTSCDLTTSN